MWSIEKNENRFLGNNMYFNDKKELGRYMQ